MTQIPTVKIAGDGGDYIIINEKDFDPSKHTLLENVVTVDVEPIKPVYTPPVGRLAELEAMSWRSLKDLAESYGIEKAEGESWESVIPLIVEVENGN